MVEDFLELDCGEGRSIGDHHHVAVTSYARAVVGDARW